MHYRNKDRNSEKSVLGSNLGNDDGFRDSNTFLHDFQQYLPNDRAYGRISASKDW
jgi:hypothetical protein